MADDLILYYNPMSRAQIVRYMLEELGVPFHTVVIDLASGEQKSPDFLKLNPMGKLPTLVHDGMVITETGAICLYLADRFAQAGLAPSLDDPQRGRYVRWMFFGAGCVDPAITDHLFARPDVPRQGAQGYGTYPDVVNALKAMLDPGPWILGERFSAADVYVGSQISWARQFGAKGLDDPVFTDYVARLGARPAALRLREGAETPA